MIRNRRANDDLRLAHLLADAADAISGPAFVPGGSVEHRIKDDGTPVCVTDRAVEDELCALVRQHRPDDAFLGEEVGGYGRGRRCWVVDGIDGTSHFVTGDPRWGTLIALVEDGEPILGVCSSPAKGRRWWATRGGGAWTLAVGVPGDDAATRLEVAVTPAVPPRANAELAWDGYPSRPAVDRLSGKVRWLTMTTHPGLMVADGDLDLAVHPAGGPWDFAAVMLIVREAGGRCVDLSGFDVLLPRPPVIYLGGVDPPEVGRLLER